MRHKCNQTGGRIGNKGWSLCIVCEGRIHLPGCTTYRDPKRDCCKARHAMLAKQGQLVGIADKSFAMLDDENPSWSND